MAQSHTWLSNSNSKGSFGWPHSAQWRQETLGQPPIFKGVTVSFVCKELFTAL